MVTRECRMHFNAEDFHVLRQVQTHSIHQRQHKVSVADFMDVAAWQTQPALRLLFPHILKGKDILSVVDGFAAAHRRGRAIIFALGAHVIKCGLSPLLIEMMRRGWLQGLVLNGAGAIHDLEVALIGATSEDVAQHLGTGMFGMVEETPRLINAALQTYAGPQVGMGTAWARPSPRGRIPTRPTVSWRLPIPIRYLSQCTWPLGRIRFICTPAPMGRSWGRPPILTFSAWPCCCVGCTTAGVTGT